MKIELTESQYKTLLKMVYLGNWMVSSAKGEPDSETESFEQYVASLAGEFGCAPFVGLDEETNAYYPTEEFEETAGVVDIIGEYNMRTVWEEMILSLARRDLVAQYGEEAVTAMSDEEMMEKEYPLMQKYEDEFRDNGFENLMIVSK